MEGLGSSVGCAAGTDPLIPLYASLGAVCGLLLAGLLAAAMFRRSNEDKTRALQKIHLEERLSAGAVVTSQAANIMLFTAEKAAPSATNGQGMD